MIIKRMLLVIVLFAFLFASECFAFNPAVIGGVRDGTALGIMFESSGAYNHTLRLGFEASTSNSPGLVFVGGKWFLNNIKGGFPMFLSGGIVGYLGNNSEVGPYISLIFEHFIDVSPMFLEVGIDVVRTGRLQCQIGYYF